MTFMRIFTFCPVLYETMAESAPNKSQLLHILAQKTGMTYAQASRMYDVLVEITEESLKKHGTLMLPGLLKITMLDRAARPSCRGINPWTQEAMTIKAKPAHKGIKLQALKGLKDMIKIDGTDESPRELSIAKEPEP